MASTMTASDTEAAVLAHLRDFWTETVQEIVALNACILAARLTHEALSFMNIPHVVQPVEMFANNDVMMAIVLADQPTAREDLPPDAWSVGLGKLSEQTHTRNGWPGHVVVMTDHHYVDLSIEQADRPRKNIVTGGPLVAATSEFSWVDRPGVRMWYRPLVQGHLLWRPEENLSYKRSPDWQRNYRDFAGPLLRELKGLR